MPGVTLTRHAALAVMAVLFLACSTSSSQTSQGGGTLTAAFIGPCCQNVDVANPLQLFGSAQFFDKIYEHLITYSVDPKTNSYGPIVPDLAASWSTSSDHATWTFKLQPNVKWHDGTRLSSADVAFSLAVCLDPKTGTCRWAGSLSDIAGADALKAGSSTGLSGVKTPDPLTVQITTTQPDAAMLDTLANVWIVQEKSLGTVPRDQIAKSAYWTTPGQAVGTGPFKLAKYQHGQFMELDRFDQYWRGKPKLDKIIRREFADPATAQVAFDAGQIDLTYLTADEAAREKNNQKAQIFAGPSQADNLIQPSPTVHPALGNKLFLQGLSYAIDRRAIINNLYFGGGRPLSCIYGPPALRGQETQYTYDPVKAKQLIQQSGVDVSKLPVWDFDTYYADALSLNVMTAIQGYWAAVGVRVKPQALDNATFDKKFKADGKSPLTFQGSQNGPDGNIAATEFGSFAAYPKGDNGYTGYFYNNPEVDRLLKQGLAEFDSAKRAQIYQQVCAITGADEPWIVLYETTRYFIVSKKIGNMVLTPAPGGGSYYDAAEKWTVQR